MLDWEAIQRLGFPIVLVIYLFSRFEPLLRRVLDGQEHLRTALYELRRAQLLYIVGHPQFSKTAKEQAAAILSDPVPTTKDEARL